MQKEKADGYVKGADPVFERAAASLLPMPGGFMAHPKNQRCAIVGVTINTARLPNVSNQSKPDLFDIKLLKSSTPLPVVYSEFWLTAGCDRLPPKLAYIALDLALLHHSRWAIKFMQQALNVPVSGELDKITVAAAMAAKQSDVVAKLHDIRANFYKRLLASNPELSTFRHDWLNRNRSVCDLSLRMF